MKTKSAGKTMHKLGVDTGGIAKKPRRLDANFAQSKDIHEDRGAIQSHLAKPKRIAATRRK
jgi:hypothetical protein